MKRLTCEMCGSTDLLKQNGVFVCQSCGCQYSIEEAKNLLVEVEGTVSVQGTVQIDKTSDVQKHLANARRALAKEDWEDVVKYYNLVEENDPTNIEAIFYSIYGKAKQTLTSDDFYKREQVFKSLINSISIIDDNFNLAKEQEQREIIIKISQAILDMASSAYVYTKTVNGFGELKESNSIKTRQLFNDLQGEFVRTLQHIISKYDDKRKTIYLLELVVDQSDFILVYGKLVDPSGFMGYRCAAVELLKEIAPNHKLVQNKQAPVVKRNYKFTDRKGNTLNIDFLIDGHLLVLLDKTDDGDFTIFNDKNASTNSICFSLDDIDILSFESDRHRNENEEIEPSLKVHIFKQRMGGVFITVYDKEQFELIRALFVELKNIVSQKCSKCIVEDIDNFSLEAFSSDNNINKDAVMGLPTKSEQGTDRWGGSFEIFLNTNGVLTVKQHIVKKSKEVDGSYTLVDVSEFITKDYYLWDISDIKLDDRSVYIIGRDENGIYAQNLIQFKDTIPNGVIDIAIEIKKRIIACGNKSCIFKGFGTKCNTMYPGSSMHFTFGVAGQVYQVVLDKQYFTVERYGDNKKTIPYETSPGFILESSSLSATSTCKFYYTLDGSISKNTSTNGCSFAFVMWNATVKDVTESNKLLYELALRINYCKKIHGITHYSEKDLAALKKAAESTPKAGCYIATSVYGSYDCPQVWTLRRYRDEVLGSTWYGRLFIKLYYAISPTLVKWFGKTKWFQKMWQGKLDCMVKKLNAKGFEDTPYKDKDWR